MTLSLIKGYRAMKTGKLTWEEYIHNIFRLVAGDPHEDDDWHEPHDDLAKIDSFAFSIFSWHRHLDPIKGACVFFFHLLVAYDTNRIFRRCTHGGCISRLSK